MEKNNQIDLFDHPHYPNLGVTVKGLKGTVFQKEVVKDIHKRAKKNKSQNDRILELFQFSSGRKYTAWEIKSILGFELITSVRRALTTLKNEGLLIKLDEKKMERQGEQNHLFTLR